MLKNLIKRLRSSGRAWTLEEVRGLIATRKIDEAEEALDRLHPLTPHREITQTCLRAEIAFHRNQDEAAEEGFRSALKEAPGFPEAHYGLSLVLLERGDTEAAVEHAQFAKVTASADPRFLAQLGLCYLRLGSYGSAEDPLKRAAQLDPEDKYVWNNLGILAAACGRSDEAKQHFERALAIDPQFRQAAMNLGSAAARRPADEVTVKVPGLHLQHGAEHPWGADFQEASAAADDGDRASALEQSEELLLSWPDDVDLACACADLYRRCGDTAGGVDLLRAFVTRHPASGPAYAEMGHLFAAIEDYAHARDMFQMARELGDDRTRTLSGLASAFQKLEQYGNAVATYRVILLRDDSEQYKVPFAFSLTQACLYDEAIELYEQLIAGGQREAVLPGYTLALQYVGRFDEALTNLEEMLRYQPNAPTIRAVRGIIRLLHGDFAGGWDDYSLRGLSYSKYFRRLPFAKWEGESLVGKKIVVLAEQGLGDQVMFASCLPDLAASGAERLVIEVMDRVSKTLVRSFPQHEVIASDQRSDLGWASHLSDFDYFVPLGDLPRFYRRSTESFPRAPYLVPDAGRVEYWRARLAEAGPRPWLGYSWRGGMESTRSAVRTMAVSNLQSLMQDIGGSWISLQYGEVREDLERARSQGIEMTHWGEAIADLDEFAALIAALDGVVTVCNTTVHYAGALGKKVWVMAPRVPEWRYGLHQMPWYPDVRIFKQHTAGEWEPVLTAIHGELRRTFLSQPNRE